MIHAYGQVIKTTPAPILTMMKAVKICVCVSNSRHSSTVEAMTKPSGNKGES